LDYVAAIMTLAIACPFAAARADDYPSRPITLVVPFPAGGTNTIMARIVADKLADALGQQVIVDNRGGGAGGTIGTRQVAHAEPDGYTILLAFTSTLSTAPSMYANLGYDVRKDFAPIGLISSSPSVLSVHPGLPARSVAELIALLKAGAEPFQYGSPGVGSINQLAAELFAHMAGVKLTQIPYKGTAPLINDLIGGHVRMAFSPIPVAYGAIAAGKLRALATTGTKRSPLLPDVPTIAESGLAGYQVGPDRRASQPRAQRRARDRRGAQAARQRGRRAVAEHAGGLRRRHRRRGDQMVHARQIDRLEAGTVKAGR
jgi:tripartite-type tricarboxylate transporter receptor subunit TctC